MKAYQWFYWTSILNFERMNSQPVPGATKQSVRLVKFLLEALFLKKKKRNYPDTLISFPVI
jgi:hypothetical protein